MKSNSRSDKRFCNRRTSPDTRNKRKGNTALQHDNDMFGLGGREKHTHTTDKLSLQVQTSIEGTTAPRCCFHLRRDLARPRTATRAEGSPPRRKTSAPRLGHRSQGLLQGPGPSRYLDRPLRSLSQLSPEDISPAHGLGSPTPTSIRLVDDLARF